MPMIDLQFEIGRHHKYVREIAWVIGISEEIKAVLQIWT